MTTAGGMSPTGHIAKHWLIFTDKIYLQTSCPPPLTLSVGSDVGVRVRVLAAAG
ncbi:MAG: hypothetical protein OXI96_06910 [Acidimicrobiaceae bacterium]|nr:hypothetical protein [Acidimicrobiaceae bacterium]